MSLPPIGLDAQLVAKEFRAHAERVVDQVRHVMDEATDVFLTRFKEAVAQELARHPEATQEVKRVLREVQSSFE